MLGGEEGVREIAKELFEETSNTVYIVIEVFGVAEVDFGGI